MDQLQDQGRQFFEQTDKNRVDLEGGVVFLSKIFDWHKADFERQSGSVSKFIETYLPEATASELRRGKFRVRHTDYDWSLNEWKSAE